MPATLHVDLAAVVANYRLLARHFTGSQTGAVVKADGYGLGAVEISRALAGVGCVRFFVAHLEEGIALRASGAVPETACIYLFHGAPRGYETECVAHGLTPVVNSLDALERWTRLDTPPPALQVDTGMTRLGLTHHELLTVHCPIALLLSHLACANTPLHPKNEEQRVRFAAAAACLPGVPTSLCNSAGVFLPSTFHGDVARPGCALYGITPTDAPLPDLRPVARWVAPLLQVRTLDRDETIGYGASCAFPKGSRIAILEVGYADGYMRTLSNRGVVLFGHVPAPVVGRVSMDMIAVDVSQIEESALGDAMVMCAAQPVDILAQQCGTIGYEILTGIGPRVTRVYN